MSEQEPTLPTRRTLAIPLTPGVWADLAIPFPMTAEGWDRFHAILASMKPGLVLPEDDATTEHGGPPPELE